MADAATANTDIPMGEFERQLWDLFIFSKRVLGYEQITKLHVEWFKSLLASQFVLLLAPRGHLKSTVVTTCYALWRLVQNNDLRILIVNETLIMARKLLDGIKQHILSNDNFRNRFGAWDMAASKWTEDSVVIPRSRILKEPSLSAGGVLGNLVSLHNDLIILDDPVSDKNSYTPHQRQKLLNWFKNVILPALEPDGQLILVGTRWHSQDLYGHILEDAGFKHWTRIVQSAEWKDQDGNRHILFPERFSAKKLDELRGTMGTSSYYCQMLNDVSGQEGNDFKLEWLSACYYDHRPEKLNIYLGVDLAMTKKEEGSRFAITAIGLDSAGDTYVLDSYRGRIDFPTQIQTIKRYARTFRPMVVAIETNAYQEAMVQALRIDEETKRLNIKPINTSGEKRRRLKALAVLFEQGRIRIPRGLVDFEEEYANFPNGSDDMLDSLVLALKGVDEQRREPSITFAEDLA